MDPYREPAKVDIVEVDIGKVVAEIQASAGSYTFTKYGRCYINDADQIKINEFNIGIFLREIHQLGFLLFHKDYDNSDRTTDQIAISKHAIEKIVFKNYSHKVKVDLNKKKEASRGEATSGAVGGRASMTGILT